MEVKKCNPFVVNKSKLKAKPLTKAKIKQSLKLNLKLRD